MNVTGDNTAEIELSFAGRAAKEDWGAEVYDIELLEVHLFGKAYTHHTFIEKFGKPMWDFLADKYDDVEFSGDE